MVLVEMAMHRLAMDKLMSKGFTLVSVPAFAREEALYGTGHFPNGRDQAYHIPEHNLYLAGTAEVQINSLHAGEMLNEADLPLLYAGYSPCFRSEAGSYGRDVRGLIRVHQFMKVEQFIICKNDPTESEKWHQMLLETSEEIVRDLELPYRVVECCTGDMGLERFGCMMWKLGFQASKNIAKLIAALHYMIGKQEELLFAIEIQVTKFNLFTH